MAKIGSPPMAAGRRCDSRTRQSISHNSFAITGSHKALMTACEKSRYLHHRRALDKIGLF